MSRRPTRFVRYGSPSFRNTEHSHPLPCRVSRRPFQTHPKRGMSRNVKRGVSDNTMCLCVPQSAQVYPDSGQKIPTPARPKPFGEDTAPETFWSQLFIKSDYRTFPSGLSQNYICGIARGVSLEDGRLQTDCRDLEVEQPRWWCLENQLRAQVLAWVSWASIVV